MGIIQSRTRQIRSYWYRRIIEGGMTKSRLPAARSREGRSHGPPQRGPCPPSLRRLRHGDVGTLRELTDQDAVWHTPGRNLVSGYYRGQDEILGFFARVAELTGGTFRAELHDVVANDEHAVAIYVTRGEREGRTLENRTVLVSHVRNGKFTESWLMSDDQYAADEFFSQHF